MENQQHRHELTFLKSGDLIWQNLDHTTVNSGKDSDRPPIKEMDFFSGSGNLSIHYDEIRHQRGQEDDHRLVTISNDGLSIPVSDTPVSVSLHSFCNMSSVVHFHLKF